MQKIYDLRQTLRCLEVAHGLSAAFDAPWLDVQLKILALLDTLTSALTERAEYHRAEGQLQDSILIRENPFNAADQPSQTGLRTYVIEQVIKLANMKLFLDIDIHICKT